MEYKYIMMNDGKRDIPFIFPHNVAHINMLRAMRSLPENMKNRVFWTLVSAGFVVLDFPVRCFGESESIKDRKIEGYKSRQGLDDLIIQLWQWQHGEFEPESAKLLLNALKAKVEPIPQKSQPYGWSKSTDGPPDDKLTMYFVCNQSSEYITVASWNGRMWLLDNCGDEFPLWEFEYYIKQTNALKMPKETP